MSAESILVVVTILVLVPMCGIIFALTPWITSKGELFTVSVPTAAASDPEVRSLKRGYSQWMLTLTSVLTGLVIYAFVAADEYTAALAICAATAALVLVGYLLMLHCRDRVRNLKKVRDWVASAQEHAAMLSGDGIPEPVSLFWELLNLLPMAASLLIAALGCDGAPDLIPIHEGMDGVVNGWAEKSVLTMLLPVLFQLAMAGTMTVAHAMILQSKRPVDPRHPASSAFAYGAYVHAWSVCCVWMGLALNVSG